MFCLYRLLILYILYKWNHLTSDLWASFTLHHVSKVRPCYSMCQNLILFCCSIIFQCVFVCVHTFCLFIHQLQDIWVLSTFLVIMNNTVINIHVFVWTYVLVLQGMQLRSVIAGSYGNSMFNFLREAKLGSKQPSCFPNQLFYIISSKA